MANRVAVNINVNDNSRAALASLRQSMQRTQRQIRSMGGQADFTVNIDPGSTRREIRRIRRQLRGLPVTIRTTLNPPTPGPSTLRRRIMRTLGRGITIPVRFATNRIRATVRGVFRTIAGLIGGIMEDGIGQGILNAFKAAGPAGGAILAAALATAVSFIGAALAATLVFAFGAAFVGLAAYIAVTSGKVTKQWDATLKRLSEKFKGAAEPIIPVIEHAITLMEKLGDSFAPHFKIAIAESAPAVTSFLDSIAEGIKAFGKRAFKPMMEGFDTFLLAFGPEFETFMQGLGDSFGALGRTASKHSGELAMALRGVLGLITTLIDIVNFLAVAWTQALRGITYAWGLVLQAMVTVTLAISKVIEAILAVASYIPGIGGAAKRAKEDFKEFSDATVEKLQRMSQESKDWGKNMDRANKKRQLQVDISSLQSRLKIARDDLTRTANKKAKAKVQADIDQLNAQLRRAREALNALNGKTATTYVDVWTRNRTYGGNSVTGARATGGIIGAATGGIRNNMTLVGEHGPELANLPPGSHVRSNSDSRRMMSQSGSSEPTVIRIEAGNDDTSRLLLKILRNAIRVQGGDVQVVLGR